MKKRNAGISKMLWMVMEIALALVVIFTVGGIMSDLVNGNAWFQSFFAKDNAYVMESLHAVPNGEVHLGYLWSNPLFQVKFTEGTVDDVHGAYVEVQRIDDEHLQRATKRKFYGTSEGVLREEITFEPAYYEFSLLREPGRHILVSQQFEAETCEGKAVPIDELSFAASANGVEQKDVDAFLRDVEAGIRTARAGKAPLGTSGPSIRVVVARSLLPSTEVYIAKSDDFSLRMACVLSKALGSQENPVRYGHISQADQAIQQYTDDIVVVLRVEETGRLATERDRLREGILAYWTGGGSP